MSSQAMFSKSHSEHGVEQKLPWLTAMDLDHDGSVSFMEAKVHQERELQMIMDSINQL